MAPTKTAKDWDKPTPEKPRFDPKNPGELATAGSRYLLEKYDIKVSPAQYRAVLMYHTEFQRSPERKAQREEARAARDIAKTPASKPSSAKKTAKKTAKTAADGETAPSATSARKRPAKKAAPAARRSKAKAAPAEDEGGPESLKSILPGGSESTGTKRRRPARRKAAVAATDVEF